MEDVMGSRREPGVGNTYIVNICRAEQRATLGLKRDGVKSPKLPPQFRYLPTLPDTIPQSFHLLKSPSPDN